MSKHTFKVGDRVAYTLVDRYDAYEQKTIVPWFVSEYGEAPDYGVVTDLLNDGTVLVKWDNEYANRRLSKGLEPKLLLLEEDMKERISKLDEEFNETTKEIKAKMKEASALVKEASKLAKKTGNELAEMHDAVKPLVNAMDASGWRATSLLIHST